MWARGPKSENFSLDLKFSEFLTQKLTSPAHHGICFTYFLVQKKLVQYLLSQYLKSQSVAVFSALAAYDFTLPNTVCTAKDPIFKQFNQIVTFVVGV